MTDRQILISDNLRRVRERIDAAVSRRADGRDVTLLAATKTVPAEDIIFAADELSLRIAGENKAQEFTDKFDTVRPHLDEYHFIGHLQTNKAKYVVGRAELIHSVSSLKLASEINRIAEKRGIIQPVLMEINCAAEVAKSGFLPADATAVADEFLGFSNLKLRGIMTMGPAGAEKSVLRKYFQETYAIFIDIFEKKPHNIREAVLSMGMSDSFDVAIEEGATLVRVGSAVFGSRNYV
ncbi:MAG: YggS family pyridoxal phosphate-dependent enzyme [Clostridia bacterium]|nr:YggS family pyridoxal phosphate-dependent enzyme [Clostridia bacterium]